jgi:hypothetical protein
LVDVGGEAEGQVPAIVVAISAKRLKLLQQERADTEVSPEIVPV